MRKELPALAFIQTVTLVVLVAFQGLYLVTSPVWTHWEIWLACLLGDAILAIAFVRAARLRAASHQARLAQVREAYRWVLELTKAQQERWSTALAALGDLDPDDEALHQELEQLRENSAHLVASIPPEADPSHQNVDSTVDSIQALILLNHRLTENLDVVFDFYRRTFVRLQALHGEYGLNQFRLHEAVAFVTRMGSQTNQYSERLVLDVLDSFREITQFSEDISTDVLDRIRRLMDAKNPESLEAIRRGSAGIRQTMDGFFTELGKANTVSEQAVTANLGQMAKVQQMAGAIAEFSESIRMISLNLNIEAARVAHSGAGAAAGRGFQVLATKLSEFAVRARELAEQQHATIDAASSIMAKSGRTQVGQLAALMAAIPAIKAQLDPFEVIVRHSYSNFEQVVATMETLSTSISDRLKAVIGKFQFQDLVRQEQEHIVALFATVNEAAERVQTGRPPLDAAIRTAALEQLLKSFERMASTENERTVLREYRKQAHLSDKDADSSEVPAGSVSLF